MPSLDMPADRQLSSRELDMVSGGQQVTVKLGGLTIKAGDGVLAMSVNGEGFIADQNSGTFCTNSGRPNNPICVPL